MTGSWYDYSLSYLIPIRREVNMAGRDNKLTPGRRGTPATLAIVEAPGVHQLLREPQAIVQDLVPGVAHDLVLAPRPSLVRALAGFLSRGCGWSMKASQVLYAIVNVDSIAFNGLLYMSRSTS